MGNDNILVVVALAVIAYVFMTGKGAAGVVSSAVTSACPRGKRYSRGFFGDCDPNYTFGGWADQYCDCLTQTPTSIPDAGNSPQTPAPTKDPYITAPVELCPCNNTMLIHDRRCCQPEQTGGYAPEVFAEFSPEHQVAYR